jgi:hypothetical protein
MSATEQDWPSSPRGPLDLPVEFDASLMSTETEPLALWPEYARVAPAEYDSGVAWTEVDARLVWPAKVLSSRTARYPWRYGTRALMAERERVAQIESLRFVFGWGYATNPHQAMDRIFTVPLSFEEAFVGSDTERIKLMDRVRTYYNWNWKRDATVQAQKRDNIQSHLGSQIEQLKREADGLFTRRIEDVLVLQGLTEELKPETRELIKRCVSHEQLLRCMLDAQG